MDIQESSAQEEAAAEVIASEAPQEAETTEEAPAAPQSLREALTEAYESKEEAENEEETTESSEPEESESDSVATSEPEPIIAPAQMSAEDRGKFSQLPDWAKKFVSDQTYNTRRFLSEKAQELSEQSRIVNGLVDVIKEESDFLAQRGVTPEQAVKRTIAWDRAFETNPLGAARQWLEQKGIHPADLLDEDGEVSTNDNRQDTNYYTPEQIAEMVEKKVEERLAYREQESTTAKKQSAIESFMQSKPVFRDTNTASVFEGKMAPILAAMYQSQPQADYAELLEKAYDYTLKNTPELAEIREQLEARTKAERQTKEAAKAKKASRSVSGGPGSGHPKRKFNSLGDELRANYTGDL